MLRRVYKTAVKQISYRINNYSATYPRFCSTNGTTVDLEDDMELKNVVKKLNQLAPTSLAGSWDNVGLLVEPSAPHVVNKILLTNDMTPAVVEEAVEGKVNLIISYHPPIFSPLKRLTQNQWKEKIIVKCIEGRIAVFSPHTSYDCVFGGVNDWLISCFDCKEVKPVEQHSETQGLATHAVKFSLPDDQLPNISTMVQADQLLEMHEINQCEGKSRVNVHSNFAGVTRLMKLLQDCDVTGVEVVQLAKVPKIGYGMGRLGKLKSAITIEEAVNRVKQHLKLPHVRLAKAPGITSISSVAVCAGSGSSVLRNVTADLYLTGEMSHHDVLHVVNNKSNVILCEHSNTERGYLTVLKSKLQEQLNKDTDIVISQIDADPLQIV